MTTNIDDRFNLVTPLGALHREIRLNIGEKRKVEEKGSWAAKLNGR